jgi:uncharacterized protein YjiK
LRGTLFEISGLCSYEKDKLLAVQDEEGKVFIYDPSKGVIEKAITFDKNRDYEGITRTPDHVYVLESDGDLYRVGNLGEENQSTLRIKSGLSARDDTEAVAYDPADNRLLIAAKEPPEGKENKTKRVIYGFDLTSLKLEEHPAFQIDIFNVGKILLGRPAKYNFKPSGLDIDPLSGNIFIVASVGKLMIVLSPQGEILHIEVLNARLFRQPEGIAFGEDGTLYISTEGAGGPGKIARFPRSRGGSGGSSSGQ